MSATTTDTTTGTATSSGAIAPAPPPAITRRSEPAFKPTDISVNGPPAGITVAGHGFWVLPPTKEGVTWALFRPDGANYFFPNEQQKK
jgi:hypothetical protein